MNLQDKAEYLKHIIKNSHCDTSKTKGALAKVEEMIEKKKVSALKILETKRHKYDDRNMGEVLG